jgi:hypothetical protein
VSFDARTLVSGTEWLLVVLVILVPLLLAGIVTKWTLDQALKRSRKNRAAVSSRERIPTPLATTSPDDQLPTSEAERVLSPEP